MNPRALLYAVLALLALVVSASSPAFAHIRDHGKTVVFENAVIKPDEIVDGDLNVVFGDAEIAGRVRGDVNTIFGRCLKVEGAVIDGQEHCVTNDVARSFLPWVAGSATLGSLAEQDRRLWIRLGSSAIVVLVFLLFPLRMRIALDRVERHPGIAAAVGIAAALAAIPVAVLLLISIVGIPLIVLEVCGLLAGVWLGTGAVALLVGRRLAELVWPSQTPSPFWALVLGLVVVSAAETVPYLGWAVTAMIWLVGLGASILAFITGGTSFARATIGGPPMRSSV